MKIESFGGSLLALILCFFSCATVRTDTSTASAACANLARLGCYEGQDASCIVMVQKAQDEKITDLKPACLASASSVGEVVACGTVTCTESPNLDAPATCSAACANISRLGCPEAKDCLVVCSKTVAEKITDLKIGCLVKAKTKVQLRACGSLSCQ
jgi:hypothetical protein